MEDWSKLFDLSGQVALVTGGARGLGFGISRRLSAQGAHIIIVDRDPDAGTVAVEQLGAEHANFVLCDLTDEPQIRAAVAEASAVRGRLDILVNNAGVFGGAKVSEMTTDELDLTLSIDLRAPFLMCREAIPYLKERGGSIINISSLNAYRAPRAGTAHYDAAKAGINALTKSLSIELGGSGVRVNAVAPGVSLTEGQREAFGMDPDATAEDYPRFYRDWLSHVPMRREANADDQARVVLFLASKAAAYVTGQCIIVDGGAILV